MVKLKCLGQNTTEMGLYCHAEIKQLQEDLKSAIDGLEECDATICRLCRVINPQHKDCTQCDDRDYLLEIIDKAKGKNHE